MAASKDSRSWLKGGRVSIQPEIGGRSRTFSSLQSIARAGGLCGDNVRSLAYDYGEPGAKMFREASIESLVAGGWQIKTLPIAWENINIQILRKSPF